MQGGRQASCSKESSNFCWGSGVVDDAAVQRQSGMTNKDLHVGREAISRCQASVLFPLTQSFKLTLLCIGPYPMPLLEKAVYHRFDTTFA